MHRISMAPPYRHPCLAEKDLHPRCPAKNSKIASQPCRNQPPCPTAWLKKRRSFWSVRLRTPMLRLPVRWEYPHSQQTNGGSRFLDSSLQGSKMAPEHTHNKKVVQMIHRALQRKPAQTNAWSTRLMVKAEGVSGSTVPRRSAPLELKPPSQHDVQAVQEPLPCYDSDFLGLHSRPVNLKSRQDRYHQRINQAGRGKSPR